MNDFAYRHPPVRPVFLFLYMDFFKAGSLDGGMVFRYCVRKMFFE